MQRPRAFEIRSPRGCGNSSRIRERFHEAILLVEEAFRDDGETAKNTISVQKVDIHGRIEKNGNSGTK